MTCNDIFLMLLCSTVGWVFCCLLMAYKIKQLREALSKLNNTPES
jgi:uncharacterized integral membrane protein